MRSKPEPSTSVRHTRDARSSTLQRRLLPAVLLLAVASIASVSIGAVTIPPMSVLSILAGPLTGWQIDPAADPIQSAVLNAIRLPRTILSALVGAALASAGAALQGMFRNPLADPALIGVSAGAATLTAFAIVAGPWMGLSTTSAVATWSLPIAGFLGGAVTTLIVMQLAQRGGGTDVATMLLAGIAVNAMAGAMTGLMVFAADDAQLRDITFWSLGSLGGATWAKVAAVSPLIIPCIVILPLNAGALNAFLLGESEASILGVDVEKLKRRIVVLSAMAVGAAVSVSGVIGFVGLVVPHLVRLANGPDHRTLLPCAAIYGATTLLVADTASRTIVAPAELPIGIVTAAAGAPFFLLLLGRGRRGGEI